MNHASGRSGIALTLVIVIIVAVSMVAGAALTLGYNQRLLAKRAVGTHAQAQLFAESGLIDAQELIRVDADGDFADPAFDPPPYGVNVDGAGGDDVTVDIGPRDPVTGFRTISATGRS